MNQRFLKSLVAGLWLSLVITFTQPLPMLAQSNGLLREVYSGISGTTLPDLTNNPAYPDNPSSTNLVTDFFEAPVNFDNNLGQRMRGYIIAPQNGNYVFWIASDDNGVLYLSSDESPEHKQAVANVPDWTNSREWTKFASQQSAPIPLNAGQRYYIEALMKEGTGGDNLAVRWQLPGGTIEEPIPASRLLPWGISFTPPSIAAQPTNTTAVEGQPATFSVRVSNLDSVFYQWRRSGTNIPGANASSYTLPAAALTDHGTQFSCFLTNSLGTTNSSTATLSVTPDTNAPTLVSAISLTTTSVKLVFSEPVAAPSATTAGNYSLDNSAAVSVAGFGSDTRTIVLTTSPLTFGTTYTLTVSNVRDRAATPNTIVPNSTIAFLASEFTPQAIGSPALAGGQTQIGSGAFNVTGAGADLGGVADQFQFSQQTRTGNFDVKARVQSVTLADVWTKAGLIAREDLSAGSRFAAALASPSLSGCFFQSRDPAGTAAAMSGSFPVNYPATWLRLQRVGNQFTGFASYDGQTWTQLGSANIGMPATVYFGLAVSSHNANQLATAQFRDLTDVTSATVDTLSVTFETLGPSSRKTGLVISEIMYKPAPRADGKNLEFIELFNSNPFYHDLSGYRISGDVDFVFPAGTIMPGGSFLVLAKAPAEIQSVYGITNVMGPYSNSLPASGTVRLRSEVDAIYLEVPYSDNPPWPVAADGAGHSLVLARPSYGEADPYAWEISDVVGGSPGGYDPYQPGPLRSVVINEFLAHTDPPLFDFIELYNHANQAVDLSGCTLSDDPNTNKFVIPPGTTISARGFVSFDENSLGFRLDAVGETIYFRSPDASRVLDCVRFEGQENGVSMGRWPNGAADFYPLQAISPAANNGATRIRDVVINEIMYNPISGNDDDEYIELHNQGASAVNVGGWRFRRGIDYTIPLNTTIPANGFLVVARNKTNLLARYPGLSASLTVGDYDGQLSNSGERLALYKPDQVVNTNTPGVTETNLAWIVMSEVTYRDGGRWGQWSDGGGSSLELIDPRSNGRLAANWADSDESQKAPWTSFEFTGRMDNGASYNSDGVTRVQIGLLGAGECLVDDIEFRPGGTASANIVANPTFESGLGSWSPQGSHVRSLLRTTEGFSSARSLHIRGSDEIWTGVNSVEGSLTGNVTSPSGQTTTLRFKARWLKGWPEALLRVQGNWIELPGHMSIPTNLGTPGAVNSRRVPNAGPAIYDVCHDPSIPAANQAIVVTARVHDPNGIQIVRVDYRVDPGTAYTQVTMLDNGTGGDAVENDGLFSATIPGQPTGTVVAFFVQATDTSSASTRFPVDLADGAPVRECVVYFGDTVRASAFGTYRLWLTQTNINRWASLPNLSNESHDGTWVYGNRIIYNMSSRYAGSPYHQQFNTPNGNLCHYRSEVPSDDQFLGTTSLNKLHAPGNGPFDDNTIQREQTAYWMVRQLGLPWNYRRYVAMYVNGTRRGTFMEDSQVPGNDVIDEYFPGETEGQLYKLQPWFEFAPASSSSSQGFINASWCRLNDFTTLNGEKKLARYRWNYLTRRAQSSANDYTNIFNLVDAANSYGESSYVANMQALVDMEQWMRLFAIEHAVGNWDSFTYQNSQNMYGFKPDRGRWKVMIWDFNIVLGNSGSHGPGGNNLFSTTGSDPAAAQMYANPTFRRAYLRAFKDIANGPMLNANVDPVMDARYAAFLADGVSVSSPAGVKTWIGTMRSSLLSALNNEGANAAFAITSNNGGSYSTNNNFISLSGTAPVDVRTVVINGVAWPVTWSSLTSWSARLALNAGANTIMVQGLDYHGNPVASAADTISVTYTGPGESPQDRLVINEIMYNSAAPNAAFVELHNTSSAFAYDLTGWRLDGVDFTFPGGSVIGPNGLLVVASDAEKFGTAYGYSIPLAGVFPGNLRNAGEALRLIRPGTPETLIDEVAYESAPPWPSVANGFGPSLQLIDPAQDNNRVANWAALLGSGGSGGTEDLLSVTDVWKYDQSGVDLGTDWRNPGYDDAAWPSGGGLLYVESSALPAPKTTPLALGQRTYYFRKAFNFTGNPAITTLELNLVIDDGAVVYLNGVEVLRQGMAAGTVNYTTSASRNVGNAAYEGPFTIATANLVQGPNVLAVELHQVNTNSSDVVFGLTLSATTTPPGPYTPGAVNSVRATLPQLPLVWLNEVQPNNLTGPQDNFGDRDPWVELFNSGASAVDLTGFYLSDNATNLTRWPFPAGTALASGQFRLVWLDNEPGETSGGNLHASFRAAAANGSVLLTKVSGSVTTIVDYVNYTLLSNDRSIGAYPDGTPAERQAFFTATPGAANNPSYGATALFINEFMAGNASTLADEADGAFEDWFEIYNAGSVPVDLGGFYLTDDLADPMKFQVPDIGHYIVPAGGYLLVWVDGEPNQNNTNHPDLHANFSLSLNGEDLGLFAPNLALVDSVTFGIQTNDVSQGRWPDGNANQFQFMSTPTPRVANVFGTITNQPPVLGAIGNRSGAEGSLITFTATATEPDAGQSLTFSLGSGAPTNATINPASGVFLWTPSEAQGPGTYPITVRVTDTGVPPLSDFETISITVSEVNRAPTLDPIGNRAEAEGQAITFTALGADADLPSQTLTYSLDSAPANATINPTTGAFSWIPNEAQGPGNYSFTVIVSDNGSQPLNAAETISIAVSEVNLPPVLSFIGDRSVAEGTTLQFTAMTGDPDLPANALLYSLDPGAPANALIDPHSGLFTWTPTIGSAPATNSVTLRVTDNGLPALNDSETFQIIVSAGSPLVISGVSLADNGAVRLTWNSTPGQQFIVEYGTNLNVTTGWISLGVTTATNSTTTVVDETTGSATQRYYRLRRLNP